MNQKDSRETTDVDASASADCSTAGRTCDVCGCDALIIVKAYPDLWEAMSFDRHPDRENVEEGDTDWCQDHNHDNANHFANGCPRCKRIVPGSHWIEP